jgi:hypothetical protein
MQSLPGADIYPNKKTNYPNLTPSSWLSNAFPLVAPPGIEPGFKV